MPTTDTYLTVSSGRTQPGKEDSPHHVEGLGDSLPSPKSGMPYHIDEIAGGHLNE